MSASPAMSPDAARMPVFSTRVRSASLNPRLSQMVSVSQRIMPPTKIANVVAIGMYLPLGTTFAIFVGGMIRWLTDTICERRGFNEALRTRVENTGILAASGLIAGEALMGLVTSGFNLVKGALPSVFTTPSYVVGLAVLVLIAISLVKVSIGNAGRPEDPAPPAAIV